MDQNDIVQGPIYEYRFSYVYYAEATIYSRKPREEIEEEDLEQLAQWAEQAEWKDCRCPPSLVLSEWDVEDVKKVA